MKQEDLPFEAIADPTRRAILDLLLAKEQLPAGEIARAFAHISRPAVSKHLRVLREAQLVKEQTRGRERLYSINPAPIQAIYEHWFYRYEQYWKHSLEDLKQFVETELIQEDQDE